MCGRFNIIEKPLTQLITQIVGGDAPSSLKTHYNIAPTEEVPVLRLVGKNEWTMPLAKWWLVPYWSSKPSTKFSMFNARSETLAISKAFREPLKSRRCVIPASGYYEWKKEKSMKVPYYIEPSVDSGFAFAGLWDRWQRGDKIIESCTIITASSPESMRHLHSRIPIHLTVEQARSWIDFRTEAVSLEKLLQSEMRTDIKITPVSTAVNNSRNKDERCVEPVGRTIYIP